MNDALKEFNYINDLLDLYGALLSDKQGKILVSYYRYNLSISEISEEFKISRSAVSDALEHGKKHLIEVEKALNFSKKLAKLKQKIEKSNLTDEEKEEILKEFNNGI